MYKRVSFLSGGEKARVALAKFMVTPATLLVLDEPTNHLDIQSKEMLEEAVKNFDGTVLAVSHDRYFLRQIATVRPFSRLQASSVSPRRITLFITRPRMISPLPHTQNFTSLRRAKGAAALLAVA